MIHERAVPFTSSPSYRGQGSTILHQQVRNRRRVAQIWIARTIHICSETRFTVTQMALARLGDWPTTCLKDGGDAQDGLRGAAAIAKRQKGFKDVSGGVPGAPRILITGGCVPGMSSVRNGKCRTLVYIVPC